MQTENIHVVSGKGGVGKTTVACALALAEAARGRRVLLAEIHGGDATTRALGVAPTGYATREVLPRLWAMDLTPEASLREYVLLIIKVEALYRTVFESRMVSSFLRLLPALGELTMLGKLWYETMQTDGGQPRFDCLVIDAPATGHARALLSAGRQVAQSIPTGPMRDNAERIDAMLHAPKTALHTVMIPEPMPIEEANELWQFAQDERLVSGLSIINQQLAPLAPQSVDAWAANRANAESARVLKALRARLERGRLGEQAIKKLLAPKRHHHALPLTPTDAFSHDVLRAWGEDMLTAWARASQAQNTSEAIL